MLHIAAFLMHVCVVMFKILSLDHSIVYIYIYIYDISNQITTNMNSFYDITYIYFNKKVKEH